jgi:hypothetical protein
LILLKVKAYQGPRKGNEPIPGAPFFFPKQYVLIGTQVRLILLGTLAGANLSALGGGIS